MTRITVSDYAKRYLKDRVQSHMNCTVAITRLKRGAFNEVTGLYTATVGAEVYTGPARIWSSNAGTVFDSGGGELAMVTTYCSIPQDVVPVPDKDDQIEVQGCPGDPDLVGRVFRIIFVDGGGLMTPTRKMQIVSQSENRSWDLEAL